MPDLTLTLTAEEAVTLTNLVGSVPTQQGAFPLWQKLVAQVTAQLPQPEPAAE